MTAAKKLASPRRKEYVCSEDGGEIIQDADGVDVCAVCGLYVLEEERRE